MHDVPKNRAMRTLANTSRLSESHTNETSTHMSDDRWPYGHKIRPRCTATILAQVTLAQTYGSSNFGDSGDRNCFGSEVDENAPSAEFWMFGSTHGFGAVVIREWRGESDGRRTDDRRGSFPIPLGS